MGLVIDMSRVQNIQSTLKYYYIQIKEYLTRVRWKPFGNLHGSETEQKEIQIQVQMTS